ncbi:hypothetical protein E2562_017505 [Oryza meyeriana var. granulata]|uniref:Uncharacterized protein n=1 Tax=Oryza meyeriana var. granulata TaxID=110450 RepID=A0A6G1DY41_9ORYZ|nr:hypothetical protein E2562_017505 [Oryza meyeriana var. granulata]
MTRPGYWVLYDVEVKELKKWYVRLMRGCGMARWPEYGDGDREEVPSRIGKVKEKHWRRMPEHRRQKVIANLREKRRLKEERQRQLAADERRASLPRPRQAAVVDDCRASLPRRTRPPPPVPVPRRERERASLTWIFSMAVVVLFALVINSSYVLSPFVKQSHGRLSRAFTATRHAAVSIKSAAAVSVEDAAAAFKDATVGVTHANGGIGAG